ncbi:3',5'-cyclic-nucleotide phosphodiesterase 1 [[Candida] jaroonii]|uniref:3',5'-cyclic-nucleotide phosphodiesterase 1 n=1 Tax=[Candida] jaroonii TaxID=467808 RepID=A0ACA9YD80_9ASCO|nr:3',5'-cyclic-nucleotide phosphodiesterase 1 [[Candida] jaroonii]
MFEITFLGTSGGPIEGTNCCILLKSSDKSYKEIIENNLSDEILCIDAGSGINRLSEVIYNEINNLEFNQSLNLYNDKSSVEHYYHESMNIIKPFKDLNNPHNDDTTPIGLSMKIFDNINNYIISHPHLDHINSLVLNSPNFSVQNSKNVIASSSTIDSLDKFIFNGIIWPNMQEFKILKFNKIDYHQQFELNNFTIKMYKLSHGKLFNSIKRNNSISLIENYQLNQKQKNDYHTTSTPYLSSAFLISNRLDNDILIFGDFESDSVSGLNFNSLIWKDISPLIISNRLNIIVVECSNSNLSTNNLYGHLNPIYLFQELVLLNDFCKQLTSDPHPLENLNIIVNHIKETSTSNPRKKILQILNEFNEKYDLRIKFSIALSGVSVSI